MPHILTSSPRQREGIPALPGNIRNVLALSLGLSYEDVDALWAKTGDLLWPTSNTPQDNGVHHGLDAILSTTAPQFDLGAELLIAPTRHCIQGNCPQRGLPLGGNRKNYAGTLFTHGRGTLPIQITTLYCRGCKTTYRPNYYVSHADAPGAVRKYYEGVPKYIEVVQHSYVDEELLRHSASGDACAKIYNLSHGTIAAGTSSLTSDMVWNAFYLHALLLHHRRFNSVLELPHHGEQNERLAEALNARNEKMVGIGQPHWAHACDDCEKSVTIKTEEGATSGRISACVMDGVCIGHPRCQVYHCTERLRSPRDRHCPTHRALDTVCAIVGCEEPCTDGKRTCSEPDHRSVEEDRQRQGHALFELRRRLEARHMASSIRGLTAEDARMLDDDDTDMDEPPTSSNVAGKEPKSRQAKVKTTLTRRWTHNEQLLVRPCGVIVSRCTFFEAESLPNERLFINATFPRHFPRALPSFLFFDNNCQLLAHLVNVQDDHLLRMGFPVDVFHAVKKHAEDDEYCQEHCNPAGFPELLDKDEEWIFNSSVCEQINVWVGKFLPIVREMSEVHFNFLLDEMMSTHNELRVAILQARGRRPRLVPVEELMLPV
ncbi:hypothetical protein GSI_08555 [Ganoderma sinense ZZ0214-1]|uniref:CxC5 like cysteine cluster associated with KDZ domain-containing protein n=1 Tax=Ganoderma sinense ZZ0214-1 TaxID=1077348 RepID=A0A2G8S462_9APHY|nr:hypothetical protein GSI_08555 [Ganoderma sinense ZZ0214-1]